MYHEFTISSQAPIYDPDEFKAFCISAGATTIFDTVLAAMTSERHSEDIVKTNQQRTVAILYALCFGLNQVSNWLQTDNAIFLHQSNLNQHGLDTVRQIQRIPACLPSTCHCFQAIGIDEYIKTVSGASTMHKLIFTCSSIMLSWIRASLFNVELERHPLATHEYCERETVQSMRQMKDVNPVDFVQLTLKSKSDFDAAFDIALSTKLADHLKLYLLPKPGDWPAQFYSRQIVYETC